MLDTVLKLQADFAVGLNLANETFIDKNLPQHQLREIVKSRCQCIFFQHRGGSAADFQATVPTNGRRQFIMRRYLEKCESFRVLS